MVQEAVSDAIAHHLSDPRIEGFVSVTRVEMAPDLRAADVYLSIFEETESKGSKAQADRNKTFNAINHAKSRIQSLVADRIESKFCPVLRFHTDEKFKKTMETMRLIQQAASEFNDPDESEQSDESED